jgi:hypothetical protein
LTRESPSYYLRSPKAHPNTLVCMGGQVVVRTEPFTAEEEECGYPECTRRHEQVHKCDASRANPHVCKGAPDNTQVSGTPEEVQPSEVDAHMGSIRCLYEKGVSGPPPTINVEDWYKVILCRMKVSGCVVRHGGNSTPCKKMKCP